MGSRIYWRAWRPLCGVSTRGRQRWGGSVVGTSVHERRNRSGRRHDRCRSVPSCGGRVAGGPTHAVNIPIGQDGTSFILQAASAVVLCARVSIPHRLAMISRSDGFRMVVMPDDSHVTQKLTIVGSLRPWAAQGAAGRIGRCAMAASRRTPTRPASDSPRTAADRVVVPRGRRRVSQRASTSR